MPRTQRRKEGRLVGTPDPKKETGGVVAEKPKTESRNAATKTSGSK